MCFSGEQNYKSANCAISWTHLPLFFAYISTCCDIEALIMLIRRWGCSSCHLQFLLYCDGKTLSSFSFFSASLKDLFFWPVPVLTDCLDTSDAWNFSGRLFLEGFFLEDDKNVVLNSWCWTATSSNISYRFVLLFPKKKFQILPL